MTGMYTGCTAVNYPTQQLYFGRTWSLYGFIDAAATPPSTWTTAGGLQISAATSTTSSILNGPNGFDWPSCKCRPIAWFPCSSYR